MTVGTVARFISKLLKIYYIYIGTVSNIAGLYIESVLTAIRQSLPEEVFVWRYLKLPLYCSHDVNEGDFEAVVETTAMHGRGSYNCL